MLIRFTVENFLSFNQRVDFSMLASDEENHAHHVVEKGELRQLLRTSLIYGANASGKSNLIKAMAFAQNTIVYGIDKHKNFDLKPFKLHDNLSDKPSRFEFEFYSAGRAYAYGFVLEKHRVIEEWLFDISQAEEVSVFERRGQVFGFNYEHYLFSNISEEEKQRLEFEAKGTRDNALFLTNCQERNIVRFNTIYKFFKETLFIVFPQFEQSFLMTFTSFNEKLVNELLACFDFGFELVTSEFLELDKVSRIPDVLKKEIRDNFPYGEGKTCFISYFISSEKYSSIIHEEKTGNLKVAHILAKRQDNAGKEVIFELFEESDGTCRVIDLIPVLLNLHQQDTVVVIDELERSLHALLSRKLFDLFLNNVGFKQSNSQLIATTHEVTLLNIKELFRKDEVWFIEKDEHQQSMIYSLAGADVDNMNLGNGYLNGRFGAIPLVGSVDNLKWEE